MEEERESYPWDLRWYRPCRSHMPTAWRREHGKSCSCIPNVEAVGTRVRWVSPCNIYCICNGKAHVFQFAQFWKTYPPVLMTRLSLGSRIPLAETAPCRPHVTLPKTVVPKFFGGDTGEIERTILDHGVLPTRGPGCCHRCSGRHKDTLKEQQTAFLLHPVWHWVSGSHHTYRSRRDR